MLSISNHPETLVVVALLGGLIFLPLLAVMVMYNRLVNLRQLCRESFADIDAELQRRHDLIPNLVETVKGYAKHERLLLENLTEARAKAVEALSRHRGIKKGSGATQTVESEHIRGELARQEQEVGRLLGDIVAAVEAYPDLKAHESFQRLMTELRHTEDRIQAARRFYNANIREHNNRCRQFPSNLVARAFRFEEADFFTVDNPLVRSNIEVSGF